VLRGVQGKRGSGISVDPGRVRQARAEAGLTLAALAGRQVSRTFIHQVESGTARPSLPILKLIARRTRKPIDYFSQPVQEHAASVELSTSLSAAAKEVRGFIAKARLTPSELEAMKLVEALIKRAALLAMAIKSKA